jgi:hypothetical protein
MKRTAVARADQTPAITPDACASALRDLLEATRTAYESLLQGMHEHREAIRAARPDLLPHAVATQERAIKALNVCEVRRRELAMRIVGSIAQLSARDPRTLTLSDMVHAAPAVQHDNLRALANEVRALGARAKETSAGLRGATMTLVAHMEGLVRQVERTLSHAGVYSRRGVVEANAGVVSALDIRS